MTTNMPEIKNKDLENVFASKRIENSSNKIKDFKLDLDGNVEKIKGISDTYARKQINLDFIDRFTRMIYTNPYHLAKVEFLQYIFFVVLLFYYNPLGINTKYPAFTDLLILIVAFTYVVLYFFIKLKVEAGQDVDLIAPTESTILKQFISTILFFVFFMMVIKGVIWIFINTSIVKIFRHSMSLLMIFGVLGIVYLFMKKNINKAKNARGKSFLKLLLKIVMYLPCLMVDIVEYIKFEYNLTTKPVLLLVGAEAIFVGLWFVVPYLFDKIQNLDGVKLLNEPVNLNVQHIIGNFSNDQTTMSIDQLYSNKKNAKAKKDISQQPPDTLDNARYKSQKSKKEKPPNNKYLAWLYNKFKHATRIKIDFNTHPQYTDFKTNRFAYKYALSLWFYINPQPPNTSSAYSVYSNILNYGKKINIEYNGKLNKLRVMAEVPNKKHRKNKNTNDDEDISKYMRDMQNKNNMSVEVYSTNNIIYQKWNNIVINYEDGYVDVFMNGVLVGSISGAVPYMSFDTIVAGSKKGIMGGICNVNYYKNTLTEKTIKLNYKTLRTKNFPYV
jgi:hypothetical protein